MSRRTRRILIAVVVVLTGLGIWAYIHANTYCCAPPGPLGP